MFAADSNEPVYTRFDLAWKQLICAPAGQEAQRGTVAGRSPALREAGFGPGEVGAYILCGLPDQNLDGLRTDHHHGQAKQA